jgi:hypothetical protein
MCGQNVVGDHEVLQGRGATIVLGADRSLSSLHGYECAKNMQNAVPLRKIMLYNNIIAIAI